MSERALLRSHNIIDRRHRTNNTHSGINALTEANINKDFRPRDITCFILIQIRNPTRSRKSCVSRRLCINQYGHKSEELLNYDSRAYIYELFSKIKQWCEARLNLLAPFNGPQTADKIKAGI